MALISEHEVVYFLGLDVPPHELATKHRLPVVFVSGRLHVEVRDLPQWRRALASEARERDGG